MSNPIADSTDYFKEKIPTKELPNHNYHQHHNDFDPKDQWKKVLRKINKYHQDNTSSPTTSNIIDGSNDISDDSSNSSDNPHTAEYYEMQRLNRIEDDALPSAEEMHQENNVERPSITVSDRNYFQNPFSPTEVSPSLPLIEPDPAARKHWGKTLDKVRLIANLHALPQKKPSDRPPQQAAQIPSLLPYYPPLFDPPFIALSKDEHGNPWPPVLLPFLKVAVTDSELNTQGIRQWIFRIELQYGDIKWVIKRTIADFINLHYTLKFKRRITDAVPNPPNFPSQLESWINSAKGTIIPEDEVRGAEKYQIALKRRKQLTQYLQKLLLKAHMTANYDICEFLEISAVSIVEDMGWKGKEGYLENKVNFVVPRLCHFWKPHLWNKQWVILRDSYVAFLSDIASTTIEDVFLFDKSLLVQTKRPGIFGKYHHHIALENKFRRIEIKGSRREVEEWRESIQRVLDNSPWIKNHRFGSFAPIRHNSKVNWFIDAEDHFNAVGEAILSAKSEIYIADWWLSPELYLRRPPEQNEEFRIDRVLKRKAEEGVKIYIIIYKEMAMALTINSSHTKLWLQGLHKNIIVVRHPDHRSIDNNVLFWSHHEKIVVVDNRLAFVGGLDLCWGRYDTHAHRITDYPAEGHTHEIFPGQDYSNPRVKDFMNVAQFKLTLVDRNVTPRMPWHDMTVGMVGPIARDVARHFIQRWNFLKSSKGMHRQSVPYLMPKGEYVAARDESVFKGSCRVQLLRSSAQWSSGITREHSIYNAYMECITKSKHFIYIENQFFISTTKEDKLLRNKIAQAIVERIKRAHAKGENYKVFILIPLIPAFEGDLASSDASAARNVMHFQYMTISRGGSSIVEKLKEAGIEPSDYIGWYSLRNWDKLVPTQRETSASEVMPNPPTTAPKEQRPGAGVAGSSTGGVPPVPALPKPSAPSETESPPLPQTPVEGQKSHEEDGREYFVSELIYIHDKLLIVDDRIVLVGSANINDRSQLGNRDSEIAVLIEDTEMIPSYMNGKEYKASKFAHTLRMQLFKEHLGLLKFTDWNSLIEDPDKLDGHDYPHKNHPAATEETIKDCEQTGVHKILDHTKRSGDQPDVNLEAARVLDPLAPHCFYNIWNKTARENTLIYRKLFRCVPDDTVHTFEQHRKFVPDPAKIPHGHIADPELHGKDILKELKKIRGHLVQFPYDYLKDENMLGSLIRETVTPMTIFT
ncbi:hypothetical protein G6F70_003782 [Rhizopus microsporus]|nr:hypothetical protein G6F71_003736 [Rhizopus microsporus]KAG1200760.1 hypothetical protein G6F70_003782 [Rhizopus microsporus]KAG1212554.1 hypothetical protein G6F69_003616 [Rhizopus microsporus]KAG1234535.1 hypothetical protein G6F67_003440 [Rhizopus microsporus]KAG1266867.1 hypothetical protein G6F68_002383 [Rhizopus microsporus]